MVSWCQWGGKCDAATAAELPLCRCVLLASCQHAGPALVHHHRGQHACLVTDQQCGVTATVAALEEQDSLNYRMA
jgi:hypothetical protein